MTRSRFWTRQRLFQLHGWAGVNLGLLLLVICLSGAVATLSSEIDWLLNPSIRATGANSHAGWAKVYESARAASEGEKILYVTAPLSTGFAYEAVTMAPDNSMRRIFIDPQSGEVQATGSWFNTQRFFRDFHRFLFMPLFGRYLIYVFGLVLLFSAMTGILFYKSWYKHLFTLRFHRGTRAFWSDLHRLTGVWSVLFAIIIGGTGVWYFVEDLLYRFELMPPEPAIKIEDQKLAALGPATQPLDLDELVARAHRVFPELEVQFVVPSSAPNEPVRFAGQATAWLVRERANRVMVDPFSGDMLYLQRGEDLSLFERWTDTADPLHFGTFAGLSSKVIWFAFGMLLPLLTLTGGYLSWKRARTMINKQRVTGFAGLRRAVLSPWQIGTFVVLILATNATHDALVNYAISDDSDALILGQNSVGRWSVEARQVSELAPGASTQFLLNVTASEGLPLYRRIECWLEDNATAGKPVRLNAAYHPSSVRLNSPPTLSKEAKLKVRVEGFDGANYTTEFELPSAARELTQSRDKSQQVETLSAIQSLRPRAVVTAILAYLLLNVVIILAWYAFVFGTRVRSSN